ncbi:histidine phosphatase superfamily [Infundibulicybe gibba]|nr:histidine phosphatase superfamily [Infundibulicybe gibba]
MSIRMWRYLASRHIYVVDGDGYVARVENEEGMSEPDGGPYIFTSPTTFPLNRTIYVDFSHDSRVIAIHTALGRFNIPRPLDPTGRNKDDGWKASKMAPFSARMVVEKLACGGGEFVRILVNDAVQLLKFCGAGGDGVCRLPEFVESQAYARSDGMGDSLRSATRRLAPWRGRRLCHW